jgi:hypothetical protein
MKEINDLIYKLEINYINNLGLDTYILFQLDDNGLRTKSVKVGNDSFTTTFIKGQVHSANFVRGDKHGGWEYDCESGKFLPAPKDSNISVEDANTEIKKIKWSLTAEDFILNPILKNDYNIVALDGGEIKLVKTVSAKNENLENCSLQEKINLLKSSSEESFVETSKKRVYTIGAKCIVEESKAVDSDIKSQLNELSYIISQHPQNYNELIKLKNQIQENVVTSSTSEEKTL